MAIEEIRKELELKYSFALIGSQALIADEVAQRFAQSQTQELTDWKESMMKVHNELDLQGIGTALELPLGSSIAPQVLPKVKELIEQNTELVEMLEAVADAMELGGYVPVEYIRERLTKYKKP